MTEAAKNLPASVAARLLNRAEDECGATRAMVPVRSGTAQLRLHIDIGTGDSVWPEPRSCVYPTLLGFPAPQLLAHPREAVIAEKLEALLPAVEACYLVSSQSVGTCGDSPTFSFPRALS